MHCTHNDGAVKLRPYQLDAVARANAAFSSGVKRLLLVAPTGAGKTVLAAYLIGQAYTAGEAVVFFAHRRELIHQTRRKLIEAGIPEGAIGVMMASDPLANAEAPIQVASIDTWRNRQPPPAGLVMIDEAHRSLANTYKRAVEHYTGAGARVLGLTATPYRADGSGLGDIYESLEVVTTPRTLIGEGFLVEPIVYGVPASESPDLEGVRSSFGDYVESELATAMINKRLVGGIVDNWKRRAEGLRTVAFAVNVAHSMAIAEAFVAAGVAAEHLDGATPADERDAILRRLESGETLVVSNCGVLCEGWDQPAVKCAILARPTKSTGLYLQQAGRILRPWGGAGAVILDHARNVFEHGFPQDGREFSLEGDDREKCKLKRRPKQCERCHAVVPATAKRCYQCGFVFCSKLAKRIAVDKPGELEELKPAALDEMREEWVKITAKQKEKGYHPRWRHYRFQERFNRKPPVSLLRAELASHTEEEKASEYSRLISVAKKKNYKLGWAAHKYRAQYGQWPPVPPDQWELT